MLRYTRQLRTVLHGVVRCSEFVSSFAKHVNQISCGFKIHRYGLLYVWHNANRANQQRPRNRVFRARFVGVFVVQTVLARNKRRAIRQCRVVTTACRLEKTTQTIWQGWIAPTKIIENCNPVWVSTNRHRIPHSFVHRSPRHRIRLEFAVLWADTVRE